MLLIVNIHVISEVNCTEIACTQDICPENTLTVFNPGECCKSCVNGICPTVTPTSSPTETIFCTADVKSCPDGSFVARDPNLGCAFPPCPEFCSYVMYICIVTLRWVYY